MEPPELHISLPTLTIPYPIPRRAELYENIFGFHVPDPYRWMEDLGHDDQLQSFLRAQENKLNEFSSSHPNRKQFMKKLINLSNNGEMSCPIRSSNHLLIGMRKFSNEVIWKCILVGSDMDYSNSFKESDAKVLLNPNLFTITDEISRSSSIRTVSNIFEATNNHSDNENQTNFQPLKIDRVFVKDDIFAYQYADPVTEWSIIKFINISTGEELTDSLNCIKNTYLTWTKDNSGIIYSCYALCKTVSPSPTMKDAVGNESIVFFQEVLYHKMGTRQAEDIPLVSFPQHPSYILPAVISQCGQYVFILPAKDCSRSILYYFDLIKWMDRGSKPQAKIFPLISYWQGDYKYVGTFTNSSSASSNIGDEVRTSPVNTPIGEVSSSSPSFHFFRTNYEAPNFRIIGMVLDEDPSINVKAAEDDVSFWKDVIEEREDSIIEWCELVEDTLVVAYLYCVRPVIRIFQLPTSITQNKVGRETISSFIAEQIYECSFGCGSIVEYSISQHTYEVFLKVVDFSSPSTIYRISSQAQRTGGTCCGSNCFGITYKKVSEERNFLLTTCFQSKNTQMSLITRQVFFRSKDKEEVPFFLVHAARIKPKRRPLIMEVYGAFGYSLKPYYSPLNTIFLEDMDGILVLLNARGGGEYGERWHEGGILTNKKATFNDIIFAAEYLIKHKYTTAEQLILRGDGAGGMATAVSIQLRPELFSGGIIRSCPLDMLGFSRGNAGFTWIQEYGSTTNKIEVVNLLAYSPLHNISYPSNILRKYPTFQYPSILMLTNNLLDDRRLQAQMYKYLAELQFTIGNHQKQKKPFLMYVSNELSRINEDVEALTFISFNVKRALNR